jgi:hypothetical protein|tara:strand:- start:903 stop:1163 length:261 start_codon:yes stop_codon:yes gene_type:complete
MNSAYTTLTGLVIFLALFIYFSYFVVSLKIEKNETEKEVAEKRKKIPFRWRDLIDKKNQSLGLIDLGNHILIIGIVLLAIFIIKNS